jgi:hypothetical protein
VARANGFTHAQATPSGEIISGHSSVFQLSGWTIEDLTIRRAVGLHLDWPSFRLSPQIGESSGPTRTSLEEQIRSRDRRIHEIDQFFDQATAYARAREAAGYTPEQSQLFPQDNLDPSAVQGEQTITNNGFILIPAWEAMMPVLTGRVPLFVRANEAAQIRSAIAWTKTRKMRAVIVGGRDAWREAEFLAEHNIPVVYEHTFTLPPRDTDAYDVQFSAPGILATAGVPVLFGEGMDRFGGANVRNIPYAAAQAVAFGMARDQALKGMTRHVAQVLGLDHLGTLEVGKEASLIAVDGDILDIRSQVKHMWIAGKAVSLETRHTRLRDRYQSR